MGLVLRVLGPVEAEVDGRLVPVTSGKQRVLFAVLAAARAPIPRARLIEALWGGDEPSSADATLMGYVSRLRRALGAHAVEATPDGYRLVADDSDRSQFEALLDSAPPEDPAAALETALRLWRGEAFGELGGHPFVVREAERLREERSEARLRLADAHLRRGDTARSASMLEALVADDPRREDAWVLLVRALADGGRPADAVRAANRCRRHLAEIGLDPSAALVEAEADALQHRTSGPATVAAPDPVEVGPVRYAVRGGVHLGHQVVGGGPIDVVMSSYGSVSIDAVWDVPQYASFVERIGRGCRLVLYDTRGIGLSDPIDTEHPPSIEDEADDMRAVLEHARCGRSVIVGVGEGGPTAITCAHRHADLVAGLVLVNTFARLVEDVDHPIGIPAQAFEANVSASTDPTDDRDTSLVLQNHAPSVAGDVAFRRWWERSGRRGASPATAAALWRVRYGADVRPLLPELRVPTLVVHRRRSRIIPYRFGVHLAEHIEGASLVTIDGADQPPFTERADEFGDAITGFAARIGGQDRR